MREKIRALYYPDFWIEYPTLIKCILLFDEIHAMDRPSFTFGGKFGSLGMASPLRQFEDSFRAEGVPLHVHNAYGGIVGGEFLAKVEADLSDPEFMSRFQQGLRSSPYFRRLHISPGNYGNNETDETIFQKVSAIDLSQSPCPLEIFNNPDIPHFEYNTPEGPIKTLASEAAFCSAKMNHALEAGARQGFSPLADASPYAALLGARYKRVIASESAKGNPIPATDLSLAILDEIVSPEALKKLDIKDAIKLRNESSSVREEFLEHLFLLQSKIGEVPTDGNYAASIQKIIATEVRPAASEFRKKLSTIQEKLYGKIAGAAIAWAGSPAIVQIFGDITWPKLLQLAGAAGIYIVKEAIDARVEERAARRDCAISYLLDIEQRTEGADKL